MACLVVARWTEEPVFHMFDAADAIHVNDSNVREFYVEMAAITAIVFLRFFRLFYRFVTQKHTFAVGHQNCLGGPI